MIWLTGDKHGETEDIEKFCARKHTSKEDTLVILGDAGWNYSLGPADEKAKRRLQALPVTLLCIQGNHECRPVHIEGYHVSEYKGGKVMVQDDYPSILFALDGQVFDLEGIRAIAIGGAFTRYCVNCKRWADEQPDAETKAFVENQLARYGWKMDAVLTHTVPYDNIPTFLQQRIDQSNEKIDVSTEMWLQQIFNRLDFTAWYAGHFHSNQKSGRVRIMYNTFRPLMKDFEGYPF